MRTRIFIVRHTETVGNIEKRRKISSIFDKRITKYKI